MPLGLPGTDPLGYMRSPLLSDADSNNLLAAAAAAEKARVLMLYGARPPPPPLPQLYTLNAARGGPAPLPFTPELLARWTALAQVGLVSPALGGGLVPPRLSAGGPPEGPTPPPPAASPPGAVRAPKPVVPGLLARRFSPYIVPPVAVSPGPAGRQKHGEKIVLDEVADEEAHEGDEEKEEEEGDRRETS